MLKTRRLLKEEITYSEAIDRDTNVLHQLGYPEEKDRFFLHLGQNRQQIKAIVAHHLGLKSPDVCHLHANDAIHGSFNVCIQVDVATQRGDSSPKRSFMIRFPLPYRIGEATRPGNADEKLLCEAATYAWIQQNCPTVSIPKLHGIGLSNGHAV